MDVVDVLTKSANPRRYWSDLKRKLKDEEGAIQVRKELTDTWQDHGVKEGAEYSILTNEISKAWSGMTTRQ